MLLTAILLVYFIIIWVKGSGVFEPEVNIYQAEFEDVNGLLEGDEVRVLGIPKGKVKSIEAKGNIALVSFSLEKDIQLKTDAKADILIKELLGGKYMALSPGVAQANLADGATIRGEKMYDISTTFKTVGQVFDKISPERIDTLFQSFEKLAKFASEIAGEEQQNNIKNTLKNAEILTSRINNLLAKFEQKKVFDKLLSTLQQTDSLMNNASNSLKNIDNLVTNVDAKIIPKIDTLLSSTQSTMKKADKLLTSVDKLLNEVENKQTLAGKLIYDEKFAMKLDSTFTELNKTLKYVRNGKLHVAMSLSHKNKKYKE